MSTLQIDKKLKPTRIEYKEGIKMKIKLKQFSAIIAAMASLFTHQNTTASTAKKASDKEIPKKLLLHYAFDEKSGATVADCVNQHDATSTNTDSAWKPKAGYFDGAYDLTKNKITLPVEPFNTLEDSATLSFWLKGGSLNVQNKIINGVNGLGTHGREMQVTLPYFNAKCYADWAANNKSEKGIGTYNRVSIVPRPVEVSDNQWHHWVFTKNGVTGDFKIYLDKNVVGSTTGAHNKFGTFTEVTLGNRTVGLIDNLKLFNYALTATEVKKLDTIEFIQKDITTVGHIRGSVPEKISAKEVINGKIKLRWYDKGGFFSLLKPKYSESFLIVSLKLKPGYSLSKLDYSFKGKSTTYPCLSVSSGRGFGVNLNEVKAGKRRIPVRMIFRIKKGDCIGSLTFNLNTTLNIPDLKITLKKKGN